MRKNVCHEPCGIAALHPKSPGEECRCVAPHAGFAVAEHDYDDVAAWSRATRDQAVSRGFGVTGFHTVAVGEPFQNLVRVFELARVSVGIAKYKLRKANDRSDGGIGIGGAGDDRQIARGGVLTRDGQAVRVNEMRARRTELAHPQIHSLSEGRDVAGIITRQTTRYVIRTFYEQRAQQIDSLVGLAWLNV